MAENTPGLKPCPQCGAPAKLCVDTFKPGHFFAGCSNELDCPTWPVTKALPSEAEAITAWQNGETR